MAGALITVKIEDPKVLDKLAAIRARTENMRPAWKLVGQTILQSIKERFGRHGPAPDGTPWEAVTSRYAAWKSRKRKDPGNILIFSSDLLKSINARPESDGVTIGTNVVYAAIHQFGGTVQKKERQGTVYFRQNQRTGKVGRKFVKKGKSNYAEDVTIGAHMVRIPPRPYLGVTEDDLRRVAVALGKYILTGEV